MNLSNFNSRFRIGNPVLRFIFIILGIGIGFEFYKLKDFFDRAFIVMRENPTLSFVVRGVLTFIAGLVLFFILFFIDAILAKSSHSGRAAGSGAVGPGGGRRRRAKASKSRKASRGQE